MKQKLTTFTWGYYGWGTKVEHFLEAAAAHETAAGFQPPAFADVRLRRSVRAADFRDNHFATIVGENRYKWFPGLGNVHIATHQDGMEIANPDEIYALLDYILAQAKENRRVLFFCACKWNMFEGQPNCHRHAVAGLLLDASASRGIDLEVVEWPGGVPETVGIDCNDEINRTLQNAAVAIGSELPDDGLATLPWGSIVEFWSGDNAVTPIISGPAVYQRGQWHLPIFDYYRDGDGIDLSGLKRRASEFRTALGMEARLSRNKSK